MCYRKRAGWAVWWKLAFSILANKFCEIPWPKLALWTVQYTMEENKINPFLFFTPHWVSLNWNIIEHFRPEKLLFKFVFKCKICNDIFYFYFFFVFSFYDGFLFFNPFYEFFTAYTLILVLYSYTSADYTAYISIYTYTLLLMSLNQLSFLRYLYPFWVTSKINLNLFTLLIISLSF